MLKPIASDLSAYDEMINKYKDPWLIAPIRKFEKRMGFITPIRWISSLIITILHVVTVLWTVWNIYHRIYSKWKTMVFTFFMALVAGFGVTAGAHRYWSHRSYKAKWPLTVLLLGCYSTAGQNTLYEWVRDHSVHHKFVGTSADPHDASRGFFFSHIGWLMMKKHPDVIKEGNKIDMTDILNDTFVKFHTRYFIFFKAIFCFIGPSVIPCLVWNESMNVAVLSTIIRYLISLHFTWSVNSFAHLWGNKPYNRFIMPSENRGVSIVALGEGWHNYHHTFPWDYKAAELGVTNNITTDILDLFAKIGWAYDFKEASPSLVKSVARNRGGQTIKRLKTDNKSKLK